MLGDVKNCDQQKVYNLDLSQQRGVGLGWSKLELGPQGNSDQNQTTTLTPNPNQTLKTRG